MGWLVDTILGLLIGMGWPAVIAAATLVGYAAGGWKTGLLALSGFAVVGASRPLGPDASHTLAVTLAAVVVAVAIGIPIGILMAKNDRCAGRDRADPRRAPDHAASSPTCSRSSLFFGIGPAAAAIVTLVYAMPAAIRITALGIRGVPESALEAARSLGSTAGQVLSKVELPLARKTIGLAVNQTIMLALSMVVITVVIDGPGLGVNIIRAMQTLNVGLIFDAGLAIVDPRDRPRPDHRAGEPADGRPGTRGRREQRPAGSSRGGWS